MGGVAGGGWGRLALAALSSTALAGALRAPLPFYGRGWWGDGSSAKLWAECRPPRPRNLRVWGRAAQRKGARR